MYNKHSTVMAVIFGFVTLLPTLQALADPGKDGFRFALSAGEANVRDQDGSDIFDASDTGWLAALSYRINENFAVGVAGGSLGTPSDFFDGEQTDIDVDIFDIYVEGILPVNDRFEIFGRIGRTIYTTELNGVSRDLFGEDAASYGAGATVRFGDKAALRAEWLSFDGPRQEEASMVAIGLQFNF